MMYLQEIKTIADLLQYAYEQPSPVVADLINGALRFFMANCKLPNGTKDRGAIRERRKMGLKHHLRDEHRINQTICEAIKNWMLFYGRDIGTDLTSIRLAQALGEKTARQQAFDMINELSVYCS